MTTTTTETGVIDTAMPEHEYHSLLSLSSTGAKRILESPAKFRHAQMYPQAPKKAFDLGHAVHARVLGVGAEIVGVDAPDFRTKKAQEQRDAAYAEGKVPMLLHELSKINAAAEAVLGDSLARPFLEQDGTPETSVFAKDPGTGVDLRARFDMLASIAVDLKTTGVSASPDDFGRTAFNLGYDLQQEHYLHVYELVTGDRLDMVFIAVEMEAPHLVSVNQLDADFRRMGAAKALRARQRFAECLESGVWPGYPSEEVNLISPPRWAVRQFEEQYA